MKRNPGRGVVRLYSENNDFQHIETLKRNREKRTRSREFFVEGVRPIECAVANGWPVRALVYPGHRELSDWARRMIREAGPSVVYELPAELFAKLSDKNEPGELLAIVGMLPDSADRIALVDPQRLLVVVCDRPGSPGNLGTLIRSANSFGADGLILTGHAADPWDPVCIRASVGAVFAFPVIRLSSPREVIAWATALRTQVPDLAIVGTSAKAELDIGDQPWAGPRILLLGSETDGLCRAYREAAGSIVTIPIHGAASSLNMAVAGSIVLYEIDRHRRRYAHRAARPDPARGSQE